MSTLSSFALPALVASQGSLGARLPLWTVIPFALLLLAIALFPLVAGHWWERNANKAKVAAACSLPIVAYVLFVHGIVGRHALIEKGEEYVSFIALLAALFVISGGIHIRGSLAGSPLANTALLGLGALLANLIGTTGASMLLIRPFLRANAPRKGKVHLVVFFIFVVSNCGGLLTPLGDPPLFLGYLKGVPFEWTLRLWKEWLLVNGLLLFTFNVWDQLVLNREELATTGSQLDEVLHHAKFGVDGKWNLAFLLAIVAVIVASGAGVWNGGRPWPFGAQEAAMLGIAGWSYVSTGASVREQNRFTFGPIVEVAVLFAGIFVTMGPALQILNAWSQGQREVFGHAFALSEPWQFFWASGALSSFLDNAPTYLAFSATAAGLAHVPLEGPFIGNLLAQGGSSEMLLVAVSCGSVFMGANTYIGNGPNFMVKSIAEENGVRMPSFFGYMAYSICILIPIFIVVTLVCFP